MAEVKFITYHGLQVLHINFPDGTSKEEVLANLENARKIIGGQPQNSVYTMTYLGTFSYDVDIAKRFEQFISHNKPYVKAGAVLGITGLKKALYNSFMLISKRSVKICDTESEALEYLLAESKKE
jgi:hypothetical protein